MVHARSQNNGVGGRGGEADGLCWSDVIAVLVELEPVGVFRSVVGFP